MSNIIDTIAELNHEAILWDGFNDAVIGYHRDGKVVYDEDKMIKILMERDGMTIEDAIEYLNFNVFCAYVGEYTPVHITLL
jgi:hypothetical protein|tara:strand:+ start:3135 stop:3377 length:243 start_codon:yes stop_codon:yes gene_type:complete